MSTITLVTGANQGVGLATATKLAKESGHHVIIGSRNADAGAKVAASLQAEAAAKTIEGKFGRLDVLINNAGILLDTKPAGQTPRDLFTQTMMTNVVGTACLTEALLPLLRKSAQPRVVFVSSRMGSLAHATIRDTPFFAIDYKAYDASKAALNMLALNYARILEDVDARVNVACPGLVSTNMTGYISYAASPEVGAQRIVELANLDKDGPTATFSDNNGIIAW